MQRNNQAEESVNTNTELITWNRLPGQMPDAELTVLLSVEGADSAWPGYWDGERFVWADGMQVPGAVLGWAEMPAGLEGVPL